MDMNGIRGEGYWGMCGQDGYEPETPEPVRALRVMDLDAGTS
ncbi:hypothetical protein SynA15127_00266 [Synechococcus sp. A15-127]|nr:hypothetical protein SynA15127_00266 [Synechococcus sp. A15-127]